MKKSLSIFLALVMCLSFYSCASSESNVSVSNVIESTEEIDPNSLYAGIYEKNYSDPIYMSPDKGGTSKYSLKGFIVDTNTLLYLNEDGTAREVKRIHEDSLASVYLDYGDIISVTTYKSWSVKDNKIKLINDSFTVYLDDLNDCMYDEPIVSKEVEGSITEGVVDKKQLGLIGNNGSYVYYTKVL